MKLTKLETDILNWIKNKYNNPTLAAQIDAAFVKERRYTEVGFFIELETSKLNKSLTDISGRVLSGPLIISKDIEHDGGSLLFVEDGYISTLELYAYGSFFREEVGDYELKEFKNG